MKKNKSNDNNDNKKLQDLEINREDGTDQFLTTNQGLRINDNQNSLKAGERGASLLEDFILREKITHFDHERIPERIVHARGSAAHGYFQVYESMKQYTKAGFLCDPSRKTPVFVRFSTVAGSRGSTDIHKISILSVVSSFFVPVKSSCYAVNPTKSSKEQLRFVYPHR